MFGSMGISSEYTFTETENRTFTENISKALSSYIGNSRVSKTGQDKTNQNILKHKTDNDIQSESELKNDSNDAENILGKKSEDDETIGINYGSSSTIVTSFETLAAAAGAIGNKISKTQLIELLQSLTAGNANGEDNLREIAFVKNLIAKFDSISKGSDYITSLDGVNEPQDYETVTPEQVTPPIDLRI